MAISVGPQCRRAAALGCIAVMAVASFLQSPVGAAASSAGAEGDVAGAAPLLSVGTLAKVKASNGADDLGAQVTRLVIDGERVRGLQDARSIAGLRLPIAAGGEVIVDVSRVNAIADDATLIVMTQDGERPLPRPTMQFWSGTVQGDEASWVFLGLSGDQAHGWVKTEGKTYLITTADRRDGSGWMGRETVAYDASMLRAGGAGEEPLCSGALPVPGEIPPPATGLHDLALGDRGPGCRVYNLAIECDAEFRASFGTVAQASDYAAFMVAAASEIYSRDTIGGFRVGFLRVWDVAPSADPWDQLSASDQVNQLRTWWNANQSGTPRTVAHMLSTRGLGGGSAYVRVVCNNAFGYGVNANLDGSFPYPLADNNWGNWDIMVFCHELGHNFGTGHTHNSCEYTPIVDGCGLSASGGTCESGTQDCSAASSDQGTIMSYCHICSGGMSNINLTFGPRVITRMKNYLNPLTACGATLAGASLSSVTVTPSNSVCAGSPVTFTANATGPELSYRWYRNGAAIDGANGAAYTIPTAEPFNAGTYHVVVRNPCTVISTAGTANAVVLDVRTSPTITAQPGSVTTAPTTAAAFQVAASGSGLTYRWRLNGVNLSDQTMPSGTVFSGSATRTLSLANIHPAEQGSYSVVVTNSTGCARTSSAATLTVSGLAPCPLDLTGDRTVDADDVFAFLSRWFGGTGGPGPGGACVLPGPVVGCDGDWNNNGFVTADDIFAYLNGWFAYGPGTLCD